jgi:hypothetical protein
VRINVTEVIIRLGIDTTTILLLGASLATTYCFKFGTFLKSWPKAKVCLLSNSYWVISSKTKEFLVGPIFSINMVVPVFLIKPKILVDQIDPITSVDLVEHIGPIASVDLVDLEK